MSAATIQIASLYEDYSVWLRQWLRRHTGCSHRAADLAQETFCRLLERPLPSLPDSPKNYLATVARRLLIDDIRHREIERAYLAIHAARTDQWDELTPERILVAVQLLDAVVRMLEGASEKARTAFVLIRFERRSYAQAAVLLGVSDRMVKRYVAQVYAHCYALAYPA
ncbi:sigma-70 family RNA polymerase sigma factor [Phenylobacterium sp. LjRoot219]|uniref:sigma-70 family RNA polymerase sigma factor n=1 Tax=Phenylobacterium sp. LjRoot219 TaxID=3342283 RepID=UPI003ECF5531